MNTFKQTLRALSILVITISLSVTSFAQKPEWSKPYKPFRIAGNLYYVGTYDLACYLITTPKGHMLINCALESTVPAIRQHVEELGFKFTDIKILLSSQAHFDHVGGMAGIQKLTKAKVMIDEADAQVMEDGGNSDYLFGGKGIGSMFRPVHVDRRLKDQDLITLGGMNITFLHHPGHTKGASSYSFVVRDNKRSYKVLIANMPTILDSTTAGMPSYPNVATDFAYTLKSLKEQKFDLWLCAHASQFDLHEKRKEGDVYSPKIFMDRKDYDEEVTDLYNEYLKKLGH